MFGFVVADASALSEEEKDRYRALYCGLCLALRDRYGQAARACLTYDLTFLVLLCDSLHEPAEERGKCHCVMHPAPAAPRPWARSPWTDYAADLAVALAYHKCLDDVTDEGTLRSRAAVGLLAGAYRQAREHAPEACADIERSMARIRTIERAGTEETLRPDRRAETPSQPDCRARATPLPLPQPTSTSSERQGHGPCPTMPTEAAAAAPIPFDPDAAAHEFGTLLGRLFAHDQGFWADSMEALGGALGRFIYLMDAAVDFADDERTGSYNPFVTLGADPETMAAALALVAAETAEAYERLPLVQDKHLLDSILYSGIWSQFNKTYCDK